MTPLRYRTQADADLDEIYEWIAEHDADAAGRMIRRIVGAARRLANYPKSGRARPEFGEGARSLVVRQYVVLYQLASDHIDIVRVVYGARDLAALFIDQIIPESAEGERGAGPPAGNEGP